MSRTALLVITTLFLMSFKANAETVAYLGRSLNLVPPPGYCAVGDSPSEKIMKEAQRRNTEPAGELAQVAVPCAELADVVASKREDFTSWVQVLVLKRKGQLLPVTTPRAQFVRALAGRFADSAPDMEAVSRRMREHLATTGTGASFSDPSVEPIGATKDAYFMQMKSMAKVGTWSSPVSAITAITVVNELPLSVTAFTTPKAKGEAPMETSRVYLRQILERN